MSLALFDIDDFKRINDRYSHAAGDQALVSVAHALRDGIGDKGEVARWGGEEFVVLLPGMTLEVARNLCEQLRQRVEAIDCSSYAPGWQVTISGGVTERTGVILGTVNVVGGFVVTDRMLEMFRGRRDGGSGGDRK